jgi:cytoskeletal protein RodZ
MNNRTDQENLLAEVLAEASPPDFRATMLAETLRLARRRRQFRQARQAAGVLAVIGLLAVLVAQQFSRQPDVSMPLAKKIVKQSCELVRTQPLPADAVISTRKFSDAQFATSASAVVEVVTTGSGFRLINDNELLALLADKPAVLIRTGPNSEMLVFANLEDQKKFLFY